MRHRDLHLRVLQEAHPRPAAGGDLSASVQADVDALLGFLERTRYPAVASTQVGVRRPIIAVDLSGSGRGPVVLLDPGLEEASEETAVDLEGCLSLPDLLVPVRRSVRIRIRGLARTGQLVRLDAAGLLARILQHKMDHLRGVTLLDHLPAAERSAATERLRRAWPRCRWITTGSPAEASEGGPASPAEVPGERSSVA